MSLDWKRVYREFKIGIKILKIRILKYLMGYEIMVLVEGLTLT